MASMGREQSLHTGYYEVSADTQQRVQFYDCKLCRAIVIDTFEHDRWHDSLVDHQQ